MHRYGIEVIKLGGSLLDLPGLSRRLEALYPTDGALHRVLVVGGGGAADQVRRFDHTHQVGEAVGHWLAVRAMQLNTYMVATLLRRFQVVTGLDDCVGAWSGGDLALVDPLAWLEEEHRQGVSVPHRWRFTSDSIAAHIAARLHADGLTLCKSALPDGVCSLSQAAEVGLVDEDFPEAAAGIANVVVVNWRTEPVVRRVLQGR